MSGFRDMVAADNRNVFLNLGEFAETRSIIYDGVTYENVSVVLSGLKEKDRRQLTSDHAEGLFLVSTVLHCLKSDLGGNQPEKGQRIKISDEDNPKFFHPFHVASSVTELGMLRVELEAISE